ncbi:MAG TPA: WbqC family protein [Thermoanaerobaculia bacterium]
MSKRVAVLQSNYIPWKGYFDILHDVDLFIFHDDLQYTKQDWRNRNRIKTPQGLEWLTIPVGASEDRLICEVEIKDRSWAAAHWRQIRQHYGQAPYFAAYRDFLEHVYLGSAWDNLSELNQFLIRAIARDFLGIGAEIRDSREYDPAGRKQDRLLDLLRKCGATAYVSGPAARGYIQPESFAEAGIELIWKDYSGYPEYPQPYPPFAHAVTVLDLLLQVGPAAPGHIWGWRAP